MRRKPVCVRIKPVYSPELHCAGPTKRDYPSVPFLAHCRGVFRVSLVIGQPPRATFQLAPFSVTRSIYFVQHALHDILRVRRKNDN